MTDLLDYVRALEGHASAQRGHLVRTFLQGSGIAYQLHQYATGSNIIIPPQQRPYVAVSAHFDVVPGSPGANDNASAIAVIAGLLARFEAQPTSHIGVGFFIFDEEETGLVGSQAYVDEVGTDQLLGLINLEMLGAGEHLALWPLRPDERGRIWETTEASCADLGVQAARFHRILNTADHESFHTRGYQEAFTLTAISDGDLATAAHYYKAMEFDVDEETLMDIMYGAPLFRHYHRPSDRSEHLNEASLQRAVAVIEATIRRLDLEAVGR
jgi:Zn-dependent M28 family amino/carboxypeptidase